MISRDEAKVHLGIDCDSQNSLIDIIIDEAISVFEAKIGYGIRRVTNEVIYIDGDGHCELFTRPFLKPDTESMTVKYNEGTLFETDYQDITYHFDECGEFIFQRDICGRKAIELTITHGYDIKSNRAPKDIRSAMYKMVSYGYSLA